VRRDTILRRAAPAAVAARVDRLALRHARDPVRVPADPGLAMGARVCFPLRAGTRLLGFAWVLDDPAVDDGEIARLTADLAPVTAALAARQAAEDERAAREQAALDALLGGDEAQRRTTADARADGMLEATATYVVLVAAAGADLTPVRRAAGTARMLGGSHDGRAVALVAGPLPAAVPDAGTALGVGDPVAALAAAHRSHGEAVLALRVVEALPARGPVAHFARLGAYGLLAPLAFDRDAGATRPAALAALDAAPDGPELLRTLRAALDAAGDATRAAAELQVHRATFYRRLRRVERLTGVDLADGGQRLHLHAALVIDELAPRRPRR
jgi:PucR C-terminal helix-turn-helix domain